MKNTSLIIYGHNEVPEILRALEKKSQVFTDVIMSGGRFPRLESLVEPVTTVNF
ncbi:MAG: hypothetical protein ABIG93_02980 [archaeon]|nr:hypothetical protein [Nanoarchaeota archaeon]